jgi:hypothetical protein
MRRLRFIVLPFGFIVTHPADDFKPEDRRKYADPAASVRENHGGTACGGRSAAAYNFGPGIC